MAQNGLFIITDTSAIESIGRYAAMQSLRGKGLMETAKKIFRFIVSFALGDVPGGGQKKIPAGDKAKIRANLMQIVATYRSTRRGKLANMYRGTLAAQLVRVLNYAGARNAKGAAFYKIVRKFVSGRVFAANLHRAGLWPAIQGTRAPQKGARLPKFRHMPGRYNEVLTDDVATILAENWASAHGPRAKGIVGLAGYAFDMALPEVDRLLTGYLHQEMVRNARAAGLIVNA